VPAETTHDQDNLRRVAGALADPAMPVILLSGERGSGRRDLLATAAARTALDVVSLDLEGYEDGDQGLLRFLALQAEKGVNQERLTAARQLAEALPPTPSAAALLALVLGSVPGSPHPVLDFSGLTLWDAFRRLLESPKRLVLHVENGAGLDAVLRRRLIDEARRGTGVALVLSCHPRDRSEDLAPGGEVLRVEMAAPERSGESQEVLRSLLADLDLQVADRLERFLDLAALCGANVPAELLLAHIELDEEARDEILDVIDEELVETGDNRLFLDLQYRHPSFPGLLTYAFVSPSQAHALLGSVTADKRARLASELLEYLGRHVSVATRGLALLFLSLADHLDNPEPRERFRRELAWWAGPDDAGELAGVVGEELAMGRVPPAEILRLAVESRQRWPPFRRFALLEALDRHRDAVPVDHQGDLRFLRAQTLGDLGRHAQALEEARMALELVESTRGRETPDTAGVLALVGILSRLSGNPQDGLGYLERALRIDRQVLGPSHPEVAAILANLGAVQRELGNPRDARASLEEALAIYRRAVGDLHPGTASAYEGLGEVLMDLGETDGAREQITRAMIVRQQVMGEDHPLTRRVRDRLGEIGGPVQG